jgi:hypothetical protein
VRFQREFLVESLAVVVAAVTQVLRLHPVRVALVVEQTAFQTLMVSLLALLLIAVELLVVREFLLAPMAQVARA